MANNKKTYSSFAEAFQGWRPDSSWEPEQEHYSIWETNLSEDFIGCKAIIDNANDDCFRTRFQTEDIQYFALKLQDASFKNPRMDESNEARLRAILGEWVRKNKPLSPVEPFLYALKLVDGVVGSVSSDKEPRPKQLRSFATALGEFWDVNSSRDLEIARHILVNWDWYQPLMVLIKMYELCDDADDEQIDEILREKKLHSLDYCAAAFQCLAHHVNEKNAMALLLFVSKPEQSAAITGSPISVTRSMHKIFSDMYHSAPDEIQIFLEEKYKTVVRSNCQNPSRRLLDKTFQIDDAQTPLQDHFLAYYSATSEDEKKTHYDYITQNWDLSDRGQVYLCRQVQDDALLSLLRKRLSNPHINPYWYGSALYNLAQNPYGGAQKALKEKMDSVGPKDRTWLACACAANEAYGTPSLEEIAEQFFLHGRGHIYQPQLRLLTSSPQKAEELRLAVQQIVERIKDTPDKYKVFLLGCQELYQKEYGENNYPFEADIILKRAIQVSSAEDKYRAVISEVLNVIETVIRRSNRGRYQKMLKQIYDDTQFSRAVHKRARAIINKNYLG